jgi:hypothetical protein
VENDRELTKLVRTVWAGVAKQAALEETKSEVAETLERLANLGEGAARRVAVERDRMEGTAALRLVLLSCRVRNIYSRERCGSR